MNYLIPAGSKKQLLIFGMFKPYEFVIFGVGVSVSILLMFIFSPTSFVMAMIDLAPGVISGFLVLPIPNYHNTLTVLKEMYIFYTSRQKFVWKGWCVKDVYGTETSKTQKRKVQ